VKIADLTYPTCIWCCH